MQTSLSERNESVREKWKQAASSMFDHLGPEKPKIMLGVCVFVWYVPLRVL
jgi:hypothetical protein